MLVTNCISGSLDPYVPSEERPWNEERVKHLYRRLQYGAPPQQISEALALNPTDIVDQLITEAVNAPLPPAPEWATWAYSDYDDFFPQQEEQFIEWIIAWVREMKNVGLREKLSLFWHNHFVTQIETYICPSQMYSYHTLLRTFALGDFKQFVYEIGKTPAMLVYLNGVENTNEQPNENYARELFELFTLGRDNGYTQEDIEEAARALTGWVGYTDYCTGIDFVPLAHDSGEKTIFGQTGNWNYDDLNELIFSQRGEEVARFICTKIYTYFVHPEANELIIEGLAQTFRDSNWSIEAVLRQLFKSEHFFDDYAIGTLIKSPSDYFLQTVNTADFPVNDELMQAITYYTFILGQELFNPIDVAGWPGNRTWIDSTYLTVRWETNDGLLYYLYQNSPEVFVTLAIILTQDSNNPEFITRKIIDYFIPHGLNEESLYDNATAVFKADVPQNYYDNGQWNLSWETAAAQVALLLQYISRFPEFQLY